MPLTPPAEPAWPNATPAAPRNGADALARVAIDRLAGRALSLFALATGALLVLVTLLQGLFAQGEVLPLWQPRLAFGLWIRTSETSI